MINWTRRNRNILAVSPVIVALSTPGIFTVPNTVHNIKSNWSAPGIVWNSRENTFDGAINWSSAKSFVDISAEWLSIQDQIDAGYPIYIQPTPLIGSYEKIFDFGSVFNNVIINLVWDQNQIAGSTTVTPEIAHSTDGSSYSSFTAGRSLFVSSMRYAKVKFTFTGTTKHAVMEFYNLIVNLNVKVEVDSGQINADKDDVGGTIVLFNKAFKDVNSITLTTDSIEPIYAIYDFQDIPNPTEFKVLVYDSSGQRVDYLVSWKARGIT